VRAEGEIRFYRRAGMRVGRIPKHFFDDWTIALDRLRAAIQGINLPE
jgi:hypothetical protein